VAKSDFAGLTASTVAATTLRVPTASATGATAEVRTTGDPFMTGSATFTSTRAPGEGRGTCLDQQGTRHAFTYRSYDGVLRPVNGDGLVADFDTGALALAPAKGVMILRAYTSW
jgi:hypothetical protein